jgi:hypothetical protein
VGVSITGVAVFLDLVLFIAYSAPAASGERGWSV